MKITIEKSGINGEGIGYSEKKPVFVTGALPGETVLVKQVEDHGSYKTAETSKILEASPMRRESPCPYAKDCGSCELICAKPELQLSIKKSLLEEALLKYADIEADVEVTPCPDGFHYRNSLKLPVGERQERLITGMYRSNSNSLVPIDTCLLHEEILEEVRKKCLEILTEAGHHVYDRKTLTGIRFLHIRSMKGKVQLTVITGHDRLEQDTVKKLSEIPSVVSLWQSVNTGRGKEIFGHQMIHLAGSKVLQFQVKGLKMKLSPRSFYQMNTYQAVALYDKVLKHIGENENVVEAYSGIGVMSLLSARKAGHVTGIDIVNDSVLNALAAARTNELGDVTFTAGDSAERLSYLLRNRKEKIDTLIVDPPRSGLDDAMKQQILISGIPKVIYVSCNPSTLAKDLSVLKKRYETGSIEAIDLFPQTPHVETVCVLYRR